MCHDLLETFPHLAEVPGHDVLETNHVLGAAPCHHLLKTFPHLAGVPGHDVLEPSPDLHGISDLQFLFSVNQFIC